MSDSIKIHFLQLIEENRWKEVKNELTNFDPVQIAEIFEEIPKSDQIILFRLLSRKLAKETFQHLSYEEQEDIIESLAANVNKLSTLLNDLDPDDRTAFFEELPGTMSQRLIQMLSKEEREIATKLLGYPEESIGRLMTPEYVAVKPYYTVQEALEHIRRFGQNSETLNVIYIVDDDWKLIDDVKIREIILAPADKLISELSDNRFVSLNAYDDQEVAVKVFADHDRVALPVTATDGTLLGIVTVDDVIDVQEQESTEDFQKFGGTAELDLAYTKTSVFEMIKKRSPWLVILFFGQLLTASAMTHFEDQLEKAIVLVLFIPLIISSGGNSGSQAASIIIRSLALGELQLKNWWYVMRKEIFSGLLLGTILGVVGFFRILIWQQAGFHDHGVFWIWVGITVACSLIFIVLWGTLAGSMIPFILKRFKLDPATASAPFVATLVDVTGLIIYFSIAVLFLTGKML
ncbi:MAG: magnesium transporter [Dysgonamonadaceae bacterium]|jgi:magnesium transporter|nr:magnesium transporter [Dysgonamonadaceae bacterium]